jgi:hypothetical protein
MAKPCVVDALRSALRIAKAASLGVTGNAPRIKAAEDAIDAVAALIAAVESERAAFQRMHEAERDWRNHGLPDCTYMAVVDTHRRKRAETAAALASCKPAITGD